MSIAIIASKARLALSDPVVRSSSGYDGPGTRRYSKNPTASSAVRMTIRNMIVSPCLR